jgi:hypothetical protein
MKPVSISMPSIIFVPLIKRDHMRLGQLARKLEIRAAEIVEFLSHNNIQIEEGSNTRIEDDHTTLVIKHFNPALLLVEQPVVQDEEKGIVIIEPEPIINNQEETLTSTIKEEFSEPALLPTEETVTEQVEVIKAAKTELPGLKVLGKIELPEIKKKDVENSTESESTESRSEQVNRPARQERRPAKNNTRREETWKNPIAQQREREAREAEEKRKAQLELEKEKRMLHYMKKVKKTDQPVKVNRIENESKEQVEVKTTPLPRTLWGKFMRWLST